MEQNPIHRRPPRQKLKMPLFGNMMSGNNKPSTNQGTTETLNHRLTPIIVAGVFLMVAGDYIYKRFFDDNRIIDDPQDIKAMVWDGKITKKWHNQLRKDKIQYFIKITKPLTDSTNQSVVINLIEEKSELWDKLMPNNSVSKPANSLDIKVKRYFHADTTLVMKF